MRRKALLLPAIVGVAGIAALAVLFPRTDAAARLGCLVSREEAIAQSTRDLGALGYDVRDWAGHVRAELRTAALRPLLENPQDPAFRLIWPVLLRVARVDPQGGRALLYEMTCTGRVQGWDTGKIRTPGGAAGDPARMRALALGAMQSLTGEMSSSFRLVTDGAASQDGINYSWESTYPGIRTAVEATVRDGRVTAARFRPELRRGPESSPSDILVPAVIVLWVAGAILTLVLYVVGWIGRALAHRIALRIAGLGAALSLVAFFAAGEYPISLVTAVRPDGSFGFWSGILGNLAFSAGTAFAGLMLASAAGMYGAREAAPKWASLRALFAGVPVRSAGVSLAAGLLASPLVPAAVAAVLATGLFGRGLRPTNSLNDFYSLAPAATLLDAFLRPTVIGLYGVVLTVLWRKVRKPGLRWAATLALAAIALSPTNVISSLPGALLAGLAGALVTVPLFARFDLLAVLACLFGSGAWTLFWSAWVQPGPAFRHDAWTLLLALAAALGASLLLAARGKIPEESPGAAGYALAPDRQTERERLQAEFSLARRAQQEMLPPSAPEIPGFDICASCLPAREVAGDLYDFHRLPGGLWGVTVADVSGKGVPAALYMTLTKGLLASTTESEHDAVRILSDVNASLHEAAQRKVFVTLALGIIDPRARTVEFARAGHNPAVWHSPMRGTTELVTPAGIGLGLASPRLFDGKIQTRQLDLLPGDTLVLYSDGLTEAMDAQLEQFGEERLMAAVRGTEGMTAEEAHGHILEAARGFLAGVAPQDDLTLVVIKAGMPSDIELEYMRMSIAPEEELVGMA